MRAVRGVCCLLLTLAAGVIPAESADTASNGTGPLYTVADLRKFELFGVHLGMKRTDAHEALAAAGLKMHGEDSSGTYRGAFVESYEIPLDGRRARLQTFNVEYQRWPGRVATISGIYSDYWFTPEVPDVEQRIADVVRRFGPPSTWSQWHGETGDLRYSAAYVPLSSLVDGRARHDVTICMIDWSCVDGPRRAECRKKMKAARVPFVEIGLSEGMENFTLSDYEADYAVLARTAEFYEPRTHLICPVLSVH
jgi:hypothetical protein